MFTNNRGLRRILLLITAVLVVSMAGSATAGSLITGKRIKDGSLTGADLRNHSVTGLDLKNGSLTAQDFHDELVGPEGPQGPQGPVGPSGAQGAPGASGLVYVTSPGQTVASGKSATFGVECPADKRALGGGVSSSKPVDARVGESAPYNDGLGWWVGIYNAGTASFNAYAWVACATV